MRLHGFRNLLPLLGLAFAVVAPVSAAPAPPVGGTSALAALPGKAPIVVQVRGYEKAKQRLGAFLGNALPDIAPKITREMDEGIKGLLDGRETKAFSKEGHIFFVISDLEAITENPQAAVVIPVSGYTDFRDSFLTETERKTIKKEDGGFYSLKPDKIDDSIYLVDSKTTVILTKDKDLAKFYATGGYPTLEKTLAKDSAQAFLDSDVSVYVSLKEINKKYGTQIKGFKALLELALQGGGAQGLDKKQAEMVKQLFNGFLQILEDGEAFVLAIEFRPEGFNLKVQTKFNATSDTNDFLKALKPLALTQLNTMPAGQLAYTASNSDFGKSKTLSKLMTEMLADDEDEDAKKAIQAAIKELLAEPASSQMSAASLLKGGIEVQEVKNPEKVVAANLKLYKALTKSSTFSSTPLKGKPVIKEGAETVGDFKLNFVSLTFDIEKAVADLPEATKEAQKATLMKMLGDGTKIWFGTDGKKMVQITAKSFPEAKALLEDYVSGKNMVSKDDSFLSTRKQLPPEATMYLLADTSRFLQSGFDLIKDAAQGVPGFPGGFPELKAPTGKPSYFGLAIVLKPEYGSFDLFVPTAAVQQVRKMFSPLVNGDN